MSDMDTTAARTGVITSDRARDLALRGAAVRRARRDLPEAERLEARAEELLERATSLRRRVAEDLASVGLSDDRA